MHELQVYLNSHVTFISIIEILILTFFIYKLFSWIQGTQAEKVVIGLIILLLLMPISDLFGLTTLNFIIRSMFTWIFLLIIIVFQPELRSFLEQIGNNDLVNSILRRNSQIHKVERTITTVIDSIRLLQKSGTGALIVCISNTGLKDIEYTGTIINANISPTLIENIFYDKSPLHDGAIIVSILDNKIEAAGCILPLSYRKDVPKRFGTRHRAAIGISEKSDAISIVVSEETHKITVARNNSYIYDVSDEELERILLEEYVEPLTNKRLNFKNKTEVDD